MGWLLAGLLISFNLAAQPRYTSDGQLVRPEDYREWVFLSSGLGMTYGGGAKEPRFDNVFVTPGAYKAFLETGGWPEKTMFALEVRAAASHGSINRGGHFQGDVVGLEVEVKERSRWAYFGFGTSAKTAKALPASAGCQACHSANGAVENTFVQFYPTLLPVAKAKGTLK
jgi:hypothetical protein